MHIIIYHWRNKFTWRALGQGKGYYQSELSGFVTIVSELKFITILYHNINTNN